MKTQALSQMDSSEDELNGANEEMLDEDQDSDEEESDEAEHSDVD